MKVETTPAPAVSADGNRAAISHPVTPALAPRHDAPRVLVAIANHGVKNQHFLDQLLAEYRSMRRHEVEIVVLSDIPKDLGPDVEVKVGTPIADPWSLPFGYKELFTARANDYDLFIYSEDDTLITERQIEAFVQETRNLPDEYIAGFMRYEEAPDGTKYYCSMHSHYHWDPRSVMRVGQSTYAYFTNEHAASFILTRDQLRRAIQSGGFLLPARKDRYDMLVTAATDPYTHCGMKKVICISRFDEFCLHHLPNVYCGKLGLREDHGKLELARLSDLADGGDVAAITPLFESYPLRDGDRWNKKYHENRREDVLQCVPAETRRVLSVGCGCGTTEAALLERGVEVTAIPLDSIIQSLAQAKGITTLPPDFERAAKQLEGQWFDCILMMDILQQLPDPVALIRVFQRFLRHDGVLLVSVPNWNYLATLRQRLNPQPHQHLEFRPASRHGGVHRTTLARVTHWLRQSGLQRVRHCGVASPRWENFRRRTFGLADEWLCENLLLVARH